MLGRRRARAAALLTAALPGSLYIYQGDELGLPEVEDLPVDLIQDPMHARSGGVDPGRDGCRVPLPWSGAAEPYGFSAPGVDVEPWLPQPVAWTELTVEAQESDPGSMLTLYRSALAVRRAEPGLGDGPLTWLSAPDEVLAFRRGDAVACVVNLGDVSVALPEHESVLVASDPLDGEFLPTDTAVWLRISASR